MSLISYQQALSRVLDQVPSPKVEVVPLHRSLGRVLATSARADMAMPSFKKSFMDGYALRSQDVQRVPALLEVVGSVSAGSAEPPRIERNEAVQIATGAPVPATADFFYALSFHSIPRGNARRERAAGASPKIPGGPESAAVSVRMVFLGDDGAFGQPLAIGDVDGRGEDDRRADPGP